MRVRTVVLVVLGQLLLAAVGVAPQLSARLTGEEVLLRVAPIDPIDPFRGAYVDLTYPDFAPADQGLARGFGYTDGVGPSAVYLRLREQDGVWVADGRSRTRPDGGTYLACSDRSGPITCGVESWFLPQDEARALERRVAGGTMVARVRIDSRGNAALVALEPRRG